MKKLAFLSILFVLMFSFSCAEKKPQTTVDITQSNPDYREAYVDYQKGVLLIKKKEFSMAVNFLQSAIKKEPNNAQYWNALGLALSGMGEYDDAIAAFKKALQLNPELTDIHNTLGVIYTELGKYDLALKEYREVLKDKTYPTPYFVYFNIGLLKEKQKKYDEAIAAFEQAISLKDDFYRVYIPLANLYYKKGRYADCLNAVKKAEKQYPNNEALLLLEAKANFMLHNIDEAKRILAKLSLLYPPDEIRTEIEKLKKLIELEEY